MGSIYKTKVQLWINHLSSSLWRKVSHKNSNKPPLSYWARARLISQCKARKAITKWEDTRITITRGRKAESIDRLQTRLEGNSRCWASNSSAQRTTGLISQAKRRLWHRTNRWCKRNHWIDKRNPFYTPANSSLSTTNDREAILATHSNLPNDPSNISKWWWPHLYLVRQKYPGLQRWPTSNLAYGTQGRRKVQRKTSPNNRT